MASHNKDHPGRARSDQRTANRTVLTKQGQRHHHGKGMEKQARYTEDILLLHHRYWGQGKTLQILVCSCSHTPRTKFHCERGTERQTAVTATHCDNSQMGSSLCTQPQATVVQMKTGLGWLACVLFGQFSRLNTKHSQCLGCCHLCSGVWAL